MKHNTLTQYFSLQSKSCSISFVHNARQNPCIALALHLYSNISKTSSCIRSIPPYKIKCPKYFFSKHPVRVYNFLYSRLVQHFYSIYSICKPDPKNFGLGNITSAEEGHMNYLPVCNMVETSYELPDTSYERP